MTLSLQWMHPAQLNREKFKYMPNLQKKEKGKKYKINLLFRISTIPLEGLHFLHLYICIYNILCDKKKKATAHKAAYALYFRSSFKPNPFLVSMEAI